MRCQEVIEELAAPTETRDATALADHLRCCPSCAAWAERAARLDSLWQATQPAEPPPDVWDALWARLAPSLGVFSSKKVASPATYDFRNGSANGSVPRIEAKPGQHPLPPSFRSRSWTAIGIVGLAQAAAILLVAGLTWRFFVPPHPIQHGGAGSNPPSSISPQGMPVADTSSVDIEEGHLVVIVADRQNPTVLDRTPNGTTASTDDWYLEWYLVYNEVESLAKPVVAMKE